MRENLFPEMPLESLSGDGALGSGLPQTSENESPHAPKTAPQSISSTRRNLKRAVWGLLATCSFLAFTLLKIPTERIEGTITGLVNEQLQGAGYQMTAQKARLSFGLGITYELEGVALSSLTSPEAQPAKFDRVQVRPSLLSYAFGRIAGTAILTQREESDLVAHFSLPDPSRKKEGDPSPLGNTEIDIELRDFNPFRAAPVAPDSMLGKVQFKTNGSLKFSGVPSDSATWAIQTDVSAPSLTLAETTVMGMSLPGLKINSLKGKMDTGSKKLLLQELLIGKTGGSDDIAATLTGDVGLSPMWQMSTLNLTAKYRIQGAVKERLGAMLMILDKYKKEDGSYSTSIKGTLSNPVME
jgi:type II secretion system protein N